MLGTKLSTVLNLVPLSMLDLACTLVHLLFALPLLLWNTYEMPSRAFPKPLDPPQSLALVACH